MLYTQNHKNAALFVILAGLMFACMGACIKLLSGQLSNEVIVFFRNLFGLVVLMPVVINSGLTHLKTDKIHLHLLRSLAGLAAMYAFFYGIRHIPLAESVLLSYTTPLFAPLIAYFWLKEKLTAKLLSVVFVGFAGVTLIIQPDIEHFTWAALIALSSGFFAALAMTTIRRMSDTEPTTRIVFYYGVICTSGSAIPLVFVDTWPNMWQFLILGLIGLFATIGQMSLTRGYGKASVAEVGPFMFSAVIFSTVLALVFWREVPDYLSITGIIIVISAGSIVLMHGKK